ncbi:hypothetical protein AB0F03_22695 [Streptomyces sp. NPDC028722]
MKLGKAPATGTAEERPLGHGEEPRSCPEAGRPGPAGPAREEAPAAR